MKKPERKRIARTHRVTIDLLSISEFRDAGKLNAAIKKAIEAFAQRDEDQAGLHYLAGFWPQDTLELVNAECSTEASSD